MSRYIDAEQAIWLIEHDALLQVYYSKSDAIDCINATPTANVVEVVRCKDCAVPHNKWTGCPKLYGLVTSPDFYCGYGERRKEDAKIF